MKLKRSKKIVFFWKKNIFANFKNGNYVG